MNIINKITALLPTIRREDIEMLPPFERKRLADYCKWVASIAEPKDAHQPRSGILFELKQFRRES